MNPCKWEVMLMELNKMAPKMWALRRSGKWNAPYSISQTLDTMNHNLMTCHNLETVLFKNLNQQLHSLSSTKRSSLSGWLMCNKNINCHNSYYGEHRKHSYTASDDSKTNKRNCIFSCLFNDRYGWLGWRTCCPMAFKLYILYQCLYIYPTPQSNMKYKICVQLQPRSF